MGADSISVGSLRSNNRPRTPFAAQRIGASTNPAADGYTGTMANDPPPDESDLDEKLRAIDQADVLVVGFGWLTERLLVDARRADGIGPYVKVVQRVRSPQERLRQLREIRPGLEDPEPFIFFLWKDRIDAFEAAGLFERIRERCSGDSQAEADCDRAIAELRELDRQDIHQALFGGEKYHTLYERPKT
jgi:hypothetical protein